MIFPIAEFSAARRTNRLLLLGMAPIVVLAGCGQPANPHIAMCHSIVEKAVGTVEWGESSVRESSIEKVVSSSYSIDGQSGDIDCVYGWQRINSDSGKWATSPTTVSVNGKKMSMLELSKASFGASSDALQNVAKETGQQATRVAEETTERAGELVNQAEQKGRELAVEAGERLAPAAQRAGEVATELGDQAGKLADEAAKKLKETLQNQ